MQLQMVTEMQVASRQLSKRQLTWFRGEPMYQWVDAARPVDVVADDIFASVHAAVHPGEAFLTIGDQPCTLPSPLPEV